METIGTVVDLGTRTCRITLDVDPSTLMYCRGLSSGMNAREVTEPSRPPAPRASRHRLSRAVLLVLGLLVPLGIAELGLRCFYPANRMYSLDRVDFFESQAVMCIGSLHVDPVLGHAPVLGGLSYDEIGLERGYGTRGGTAAKIPGVRRVLFVGDSVTARAKIIDAIRAMSSTADFEFCNGGVEGWNPVQEVEFYFRCQEQLQADHIILTLHNNDFMITPVGLFDDEGTFAICRPGRLSRLHPDLYRHCYLYRLYINASNPQLRVEDSYLEKVDAVAAALQRLRDDAARHGRRLSVLLMPLLRAPGSWRPWETESRRLALTMLDRLSIPTIDLLPAIEPVLAAGCDLGQTPDDHWHPNGLAGAVMAAYALAQGLLGPTSACWLTSDSAILRSGTTQQIRIDAGEEKRGRRYLVVGSTNVGAGARIEYFGLQVPFFVDAYTHRTLGDNEAILQGGKGTLDDHGRASVSIPVPTTPAAQPGCCLWHACVLFDEGGRIEAISSALPLVVVP